MKTVLVLAALVAISFAENVTVVKETPSNNIGVGGYRFAYSLSDGQVRQETSQVEARGLEDVVNRVQGSFSWVDPSDGKIYAVKYIADENGFQPQGDHLPVAPVA